ncbi:hypothetical protein B0H13DRAFT_2327555 [Mycena leptocephala]|nr:hypothetical protein B0H13DRAFT_2327555 [Mycena leptocephala]
MGVLAHAVLSISYSAIQAHIHLLSNEVLKALVTGKTCFIVPDRVLSAHHPEFWDHLHPLHPHLWVRNNVKVPMRGWFMKKLRHLFPDANITGQFMQAGGATALAEDGAPPHVIHASGRWVSNTFQIYIHKHPCFCKQYYTFAVERRESPQCVSNAFIEHY